MVPGAVKNLVEEVHKIVLGRYKFELDNGYPGRDHRIKSGIWAMTSLFQSNNRVPN